MNCTKTGRRAAAGGDDAAHAEAHVLHPLGARRDEPEGPAIHHGARQHPNDAGLLRAHGFGVGDVRDEEACRIATGAGNTTRFTTMARQNLWEYRKTCEGSPMTKKPVRRHEIRLHRHMGRFEKMLENPIQSFN